MDEAVNHAQTESGAFPQRFGGKKRFKSALNNFLCHAGPGVGDGYDDVVPGRQLPLLVYLNSQAQIFRRDGESAAIGHGVTGIDAQIEKSVLELVVVSQDRPSIARDV